jgi:hypothetical protein
VNASHILCISLAAWLPSCLIYDESLLGDGSSDQGVDSDSDGADGDISGSGGAIAGTGGVAPSGGAPSGGGPGAGGSGSGGSPPDCSQVGVTGPFVDVGTTRMIDDFNFPTRAIYATNDPAFTGQWFAGADTTAGGSGLSPTTAAWDYTQDPCLAEDNFSLNILGTGYTTWGASFDAQLKVDSVAFDASAYVGVVYWARSANSGQSIKVSFNDGTLAHDATPRPINDEWNQYEALFPGGFDKTKLTMVQFVTVANTAFDIWIDDVAFYEGP